MLLTFIMFAVAEPATAAPRHEAPAITAEQAQLLLSMSGANVGTVRALNGVGRVRIDGINVRAEGRWIVIRVLPTRLK
jgi:hypothetical protein